MRPRPKEVETEDITNPTVTYAAVEPVATVVPWGDYDAYVVGRRVVGISRREVLK